MHQSYPYLVAKYAGGQSRDSQVNNNIEEQEMQVVVAVCAQTVVSKAFFDIYIYGGGHRQHVACDAASCTNQSRIQTNTKE